MLLSQPRWRRRVSLKPFPQWPQEPSSAKPSQERPRQANLRPSQAQRPNHLWIVHGPESHWPLPRVALGPRPGQLPLFVATGALATWTPSLQPRWHGGGRDDAGRPRPARLSMRRPGVGNFGRGRQPAEAGPDGRACPRPEVPCGVVRAMDDPPGPAAAAQRPSCLAAPIVPDLRVSIGVCHTDPSARPAAAGSVTCRPQ